MVGAMSALAVMVRLACGCSVETLGSADLEPPVCESHHERRVIRVTAPPPRITATKGITGPLVQTHE